MPDDLLTHLREVVGLPMRGLTFQVHVGWTTDKAKADAALARGARVTPYASAHPDYTGQEITCPREAA